MRYPHQIPRYSYSPSQTKAIFVAPTYSLVSFPIRRNERQFSRGRHEVGQTGDTIEIGQGGFRSLQTTPQLLFDEDQQIDQTKRIQAAGRKKQFLVTIGSGLQIQLGLEKMGDVVAMTHR